MSGGGNPVTPSEATLPVPPPLARLPFVLDEQGKGLLLTTPAYSFLQALWAAAFGTNGIVDLEAYLIAAVQAPPFDYSSPEMQALIAKVQAYQVPERAARQQYIPYVPQDPVLVTPTISTLDFGISGGGSAIATGVALDLGPFDFTMTFSAVTLLADQSGSIVIDIWSRAYSSYPPTVTQSIVASAPPTISSAVKSQDTTLTGWTTVIPAGNTLRINVNSVTSITRVNVALKYTKS